MRVGFFGDGTFDMDRRLRDGSVIWRREMFQRLVEQGHEPVYLAPQNRTNDPVFSQYVVGYQWEGRLDMLVVESRGCGAPPDKPENHPAYQQAVTLGRWHRGEFGRCALFGIDFDAELRKTFGLGGIKGHYLGGQWSERVPWMTEVSERARDELWVLATFDPEPSLFETHRNGDGYLCVPFSWGYPESIEVEPRPWNERTWDLFYPGSDYGRRDQFEKYYVEAAKAGWDVGVGGRWTNESKTKHDLRSYQGPHYYWNIRDLGLGNLVFIDGNEKMSPALPMNRLLDEMSRTKACVQISRVDYRKIGYDTMRPAEVAARGGLVFMNSALASPGGDVPHEWFTVSSFDDVRARMTETWGESEYLRGVERWREFLRYTKGTVAENAERLVELGTGQLDGAKVPAAV